MNQYFSVGEEVILQSKNFPELNGDVTITACFGLKNGVNYTNGDPLSAICYSLSIESNGPNIWAQSALRKKHKPSDQSFSELIKSTKEVKA